MKRIRQLCVFATAIALFTSCGSTQNAHKYELTDDEYLYRQTSTKNQRVQVYVKGDTFSITPLQGNHLINVDPAETLIFRKFTLDIDVMTIAFKYRPAMVNLPRQLNTDFNGNLFIGYRTDRFKVKYRTTPLGLTKHSFHRGITLGLIGGLGSTAVTPWTTNYQIADEYYGLTLSKGAACMVGFNNLTVGLAIGWDTLTDRDKDVWIYQDKPWYGFALGLSVN